MGYPLPPSAFATPRYLEIAGVVKTFVLDIYIKIRYFVSPMLIVLLITNRELWCGFINTKY
jgi:hypothetical protein